MTFAKIIHCRMQKWPLSFFKYFQRLNFISCMTLAKKLQKYNFLVLEEKKSNLEVRNEIPQAEV